VHVLAHLVAVADEGDAVVGVDADPGIQFDRSRGHARRAALRQVQTEDHATGCGGAQLEELATFHGSALQCPGGVLDGLRMRE